MVTDSGNYDVDIFAAAKSLHSCPTLCDPIDSSPPESPVPGILQARVLERGAIGFSVDIFRGPIILPTMPSKDLLPPETITC